MTTKFYNPLFKDEPEQKITASSVVKCVCNGVEIEFTASENMALPAKKEDDN